MNREDILKLIKTLAKSQGLYGRLLQSINELSSDDYEDLFEELEALDFKTPVDFILYVEC